MALAIYLLIAWATAATFIAGVMWGKYDRLHARYIAMLENPQIPFVRALPPTEGNVVPIRRDA
jgi:hypothetical protein